jgi:hypothetical protein
MGIISDLVRMHGEQEQKAKQGPIDVAKIVLGNPDSTPEAREWATNSLVELLDGTFGGKGKSKGGGASNNSVSGASGGGSKGHSVGSFFKTILGGLAGGLEGMNPYSVSKGTKGRISDIDSKRPQKMTLNDDEKEALKIKNQDIEFGEKMKLDQMNATFERNRQIQYNDQDYHRELDKGIKDMKLSPVDAAKRADDIVNKYREPTATRPTAPKQTEIVGPDGKKFTGFVRTDDTGAEQLYKLGSNEPLGAGYAMAQKAETNAQTSRDDAISAYKEKHGIKERDLTAVETQKAIAEQKQAEESPDAAAQRKLATELARQRLAANKTDSTSGAITDSELRALAKESLLTGQNPAFGLGKSGTRDRYNKIKAELIESTGPGPAAEQRSEFKAGSTTLTDLQKRRGQIVSFESTAAANLDQVVKISPQVGRTGSSLANEYIQFTEGKLTDYPMLARYRTAIQTAANEYAKVVNSATGGGVTTDSARKDAESLLNAAMAKGSINATIQQMKIDMKNRRDGLDKEIADTRKQLQSIGSGSSDSGGANGDGGDNKPIVQHSPSTGKYRYSTDGGKTWQAGQPPQQ